MHKLRIKDAKCTLLNSLRRTQGRINWSPLVRKGWQDILETLIDRRRLKLAICNWNSSVSESGLASINHSDFTALGRLKSSELRVLKCWQTGGIIIKPGTQIAFKICCRVEMKLSKSTSPFGDFTRTCEISDHVYEERLLLEPSHQIGIRIFLPANNWVILDQLALCETFKPYRSLARWWHV